MVYGQSLIPAAAASCKQARAEAPSGQARFQRRISLCLSVTLCRLLVLALLCFPRIAAGVEPGPLPPEAASLFPEAERFGAVEGSPPAAAVYAQEAAGERLIGYVFSTADVVEIPGYSGWPIHLLIGLETEGRLRGVRILHHEEPILAAGVSEARLSAFIGQYRGKPADGRILVGARSPGHATVDAISGATITMMVINATINRAVKQVAASRGISAAGLTEEAPLLSTGAMAPPAPPAKPARETPPARLPPRAAKPPPAPPPLAGENIPHKVPTTAQGKAEPPLWQIVWRQRIPEVILLGLGLTVLTGILLFQDYLARHPRLLRRLRLAFLTYTLLFVGWYALGQLSILNVFTFLHAVMHQFSWETFLIDPVLFLLWSFVAVTLLLWGRGVYCGWLCPFGALQELAFQLGQRLRLPVLPLPQVVHERLLALKYVIMIGLFGLSLQSITWAIQGAEIEPFKTAITLRFQREWGYVLFALAVIAIGLFNRKAYCKYLCPLGAALVIPGRFHTFEWLRRRKECGKPCQVCAVECEVQAIRATGEIVVNECHHCLDCQVTFYDENKCPPLVERRKRRERGGRARELARGMGEPLTGDLQVIPVRVDTREKKGTLDPDQ